VRALRTRRDNRRVAELLSQIELAARAPKAPLMPLFVEAVQAYATLGEISGVLRQVFGEYQAPTLV
jgi:methylmalonyl-CoA mutase N-terminal domain/subunit